MEQDSIFSEIRGLLIKYSPPLISKSDTPNHFDLWSVKDLVIEGRPRKEVYFGAVKMNKGYVGFYFMPVYVESEQNNYFKPELLKCLKGLSCFHIKSLTPELKEQIQDALKLGFQMYKDRGWV